MKASEAFLVNPLESSWQGTKGDGYFMGSFGAVSLIGGSDGKEARRGSLSPGLQE